MFIFQIWFFAKTNLLKSQFDLSHNLQGIITKKNILSFTHLQIVANLYEFPSAVEHKIRYIEELKQLAVANDFS